MLSSTKNYVAVSGRVAGDLNGSEENLDESSKANCHESSLTSTLLSDDDEEVRNAQENICSEASKPHSSTDEEAVQEDCEETNDNAILGEELEQNKITSETCDEKTNESLRKNVAGESSEVMESSIHAGEFPRGKTSQECHVSRDYSENLLSSNHRRENSLEDSDEVFPLVKQKANSTDDLLDKNFVKWTNAGSSCRSNREKDSAQSSESPSSDVEFSACSSITEDSGISSTVRDEELEEIPLNNSQFSPELYKQMSRFAVDDSVAAWIPKSSNTYAPSPNSHSNTASVTDGGKSQKQSKLK